VTVPSIWMTSSLDIAHGSLADSSVFKAAGL
jgi:hypothetical protein